MLLLLLYEPCPRKRCGVPRTHPPAVVSVQRRLGFYPMLDAAAAAAKPIAAAELLREKHTVCDVEVFEQHFQRA